MRHLKDGLFVLALALLLAQQRHLQSTNDLLRSIIIEQNALIAQSASISQASYKCWLYTYGLADECGALPRKHLSRLEGARQ